MSETNGFAGRTALQSLPRRRYRTVQLGDHKFRLQSFSEGERTRIEFQRIDKATGRLHEDGIRRMRLLAIATALVDGDGHRIYSDDQAGELAEIDSAYTEALWEAINDHCNLQFADAEKIEELAKN